MDAAATTGIGTLDEQVFLERVNAEDPEVLSLFDGWTSHSYPNPGFSGSPYETGRLSIRGWEWELAFLKELGIENDFPVFITETGWTTKGKNQKRVSEYYTEAYKNAWNDPRIVAVTPFVLTYLSAPFDMFSWKNPKTNTYLPHYEAVKGIEKIKGEPEKATPIPSPKPLPKPSPSLIVPTEKPIIQTPVDVPFWRRVIEKLKRLF
jgi:hypothetical protein